MLVLKAFKVKANTQFEHTKCINSRVRLATPTHVERGRKTLQTRNACIGLYKTHSGIHVAIDWRVIQLVFFQGSEATVALLGVQPTKTQATTK